MSYGLSVRFVFENSPVAATVPLAGRSFIPNTPHSMKELTMRQLRTPVALGTLLLATFVSVSDVDIASAQSFQIPPGMEGKFTPEQIEKFKERFKNRRGRRGGGEQPATVTEGKPSSPTASSGPAVAQPTAPNSGKANPEELKLRPDEDGKIKFNFHGQPWQGVLEWMADISEMTLNWSKLPTDKLNLKTKQRYTVSEARNILAGMLLVKGFVMMQDGEVITVAEAKEIDSGLVPRVKPEELAKMPSNEFVKVSFSLKSLVAESAVEELKTMMSPHGKLQHLKVTNRLEAMDAVKNLRALYSVLQDEQSEEAIDLQVKSFPLRFVRAEDARTRVMKLLGMKVEDKGDSAAQSQQQMMMMRYGMRMPQMSRGGGGDDDVNVHIVAHPRENSLMVNAPPDKMATIEKAIKVIDKPLDREAARRNQIVGQVYRLNGIDPEVFVSVLQEQGDLSPMSDLKVDEKNKVVVAFATELDHLVIAELVQTLDSSGRKLKVLKLRSLDAEYVAGELEWLLDAGKEEKKNSRRGYYDFYGYGSSSSSSDDKKDKFRVGADIEGNQLIVYANEAEMSIVEDFLLQMGEIKPNGMKAPIRFIDLGSEQDTERLLEGLQELWKRHAPNPDAPNPLKIEPKPENEQEAPKSKKRPLLKDQLSNRNSDRKVSKLDRHSSAILGDSQKLFIEMGTRSSANSLLADASDETTAPAEAESAKSPPAEDDATNNEVQPAESDETPSASEEETSNDDAQKEEERLRKMLIERLKTIKKRKDAEKAKPPAPIYIGRGPDGRIVLRSEDMQALDLMEQMLADLAPPPKEYYFIKLKHADAFYVQQNLEDFFKEEDDEKQSGRRSWYDYYYGSNDQKDTSRRLGKKRPLRFIYDLDSNSILVQGATPKQIRLIDELVAMYDKVEPPDSESARLTKYFPIKYSNAEAIAETIKEVYRDLLSANDKSLQKGGGGKKEIKIDRVYDYIDGGGDGKRTQVSFKGLISIGVDKTSNSLMVSARGNLMYNISEMIKILDEAAKPSSNVQVIKVDHRLNSADLQKRLAEVLGTESSEEEGEGKKPKGNRKNKEVNGKNAKNNDNNSNGDN